MKWKCICFFSRNQIVNGGRSDRKLFDSFQSTGLYILRRHSKRHNRGFHPHTSNTKPVLHSTTTKCQIWNLGDGFGDRNSCEGIGITPEGTLWSSKEYILHLNTSAINLISTWPTHSGHGNYMNKFLLGLNETSLMTRAWVK